jgi:hypothetical protein
MARRRNEPTPEDPRVRVLAAYRGIFETEDGELVLADMAKSYDVVTFAGEQTHLAAFKEGQRSVYRALLAVVEEAKGGRHPDTAESDEPTE